MIDDPTAAPLHRRAFLERMAAALAAAGLPACPRRDPPEQIVPYARQPEFIVPGAPLWFASMLALDGYAQGILVETHEGRPTKIEGAPEHPASLGGTDAFAQAAVRELYDPTRSTGVRRDGAPSDWPEFLRDARPWLDRRAALLTRPTTSRALVDAIARLQARHPGLAWHTWEPVSYANVHTGVRAALGASLDFHLRLERARVVVSLDDDLLAWSPGRLRHARALARRRRPELPAGAALRLYVAESFPTITGAAADHRRSTRVTDIPRLAHALASALAGLPTIDDPWLADAALDLRRAGPAGLVVAGPQQPAHVHALAHAANHLIGAAGHSLVYTPRLQSQPDAPAVASLRALVDRIDRGDLDALFILDTDPAFDAPADLEFAGALARVPFTAHLGVFRDETAERCRWHVPQAHALEAWGDARADDGTVTLAQPTIRPLYGGLTPPELLTALADDKTRGRDLLERAFTDRPAIDWRAAIHDGRLPPSATPRPVATALDPGALAALLAEPVPADISAESLVLALRPDPAAWDGRLARDPWLQELPRPITRLVWGNAAYLAPATARARGVAHGQLVRLAVDGRAIEAPVYVLGGCPEDQVTLHLGHGRGGVGVDAYPLRTARALWSAPVQLTALDRRRDLIVDRHFADEQAERGDTHARWATREDYARLGARAFAGAGLGDAPDARPPSLHPSRPPGPRAWAMTIDLNACIGCNACVVACQAENNIPTVGPAEAARGRILHWIRIDTYAGAAGPGWRFQPVPCMQCEHAPCEVVCPTGATQHSHDGLNDMVYNRCVGTRYCSNNCPYKVRRFNFFDYAAQEPVALRSQRNPDVTVRTRGVMEKCTYCVQRIRGAEIAGDREGRPLPVVTACQGACPAGAIEFGDLAQADGLVAARRREPRAYALLHELGTRPRTSYLARLHDPRRAGEEG